MALGGLDGWGGLGWPWVALGGLGWPLVALGASGTTVLGRALGYLKKDHARARVIFWTEDVEGLCFCLGGPPHVAEKV